MSDDGDFIYVLWDEKMERRRARHEQSDVFGFVVYDPLPICTDEYYVTDRLKMRLTGSRTVSNGNPIYIRIDEMKFSPARKLRKRNG